MRREAGLTLYFPPSGASAGEAAPGRPDARAIQELAGRSGAPVAFSVSHLPKDHPYWVELLALGLTFDLRGLAPRGEVHLTLAVTRAFRPRREASDSTDDRELGVFVHEARLLPG